jgi:hypothetical protein
MLVLSVKFVVLENHVAMAPARSADSVLSSMQSVFTVSQE